MSRTRVVLVAILLLSVGARLRGIEIDIEFEILESEREESISYSTGNTSKQTIRHSGTMWAQMTFDSESQRPTALRFIGETVSESNTSFTNTAQINFIGLGTKEVTAVQSSSGLQFRVETIGEAQPVDLKGRLLDMHRMQTFPTAGILTAKLTIDGRTQTRSINVAEDPPDIVEPAIGTEIYLQVSELENHGSVSDYKLTFQARVDGVNSDKIQNTDTTVTSTTKGKTVAEARFSAPNDYGHWLLENGYDLDEERIADRRGIPFAILFSFRMAADRGAGIPWSFIDEGGHPLLVLRLPVGGLARALSIESCEDLKTGDWEALDPDDFLDGNANLEQGATGERSIRFGDSRSRFYRVVPLINIE